MTLTNDNLLLLRRMTFTNDDLDTCTAQRWRWGAAIHSILLLSPFLLLSIQVVQLQHRTRMNWINQSMVISLYYFPSSFFSSFVVQYSRVRSSEQHLGITSETTASGGKTKRNENGINPTNHQHDDHLLNTNKNFWYKNSFLPVDSTFASVVIIEFLLMRWLLKDTTQKEEELIAAPVVAVVVV